MKKILDRKFLGFATCWTRPWWKFWIKVYADKISDQYIEDCNWIYYCSDCRNVCDHWEIWLANPFRRFWKGEIFRKENNESNHQER